MSNVVEVRTKHPKVKSSRVLREDELVWIVGCESEATDCNNEIAVSKIEWHPVDFTKPGGDRVEVRLSAPNRRICAAH